MKQIIVRALLPVVVCVVAAAVVQKARAWNAPLSTQNEILKLAAQRKHAEAAALGHQYLARTEVVDWRLEECMLLTTIANQERLASERTQALQTLTTFDRRCRGTGKGGLQYQVAYADGVRRVVNGEPIAVMDSIHYSHFPRPENSRVAGATTETDELIGSPAR